MGKKMMTFPYDCWMFTFKGGKYDFRFLNTAQMAISIGNMRMFSGESEGTLRCSEKQNMLFRQSQSVHVEVVY